MTAETDAWRLRRKNAKVLRLAIELSECEASKEAKAARHAKEQDHLLRRLSGLNCNSDSDLTGGSTSSYDDGASPHADAYMEEGHSHIDDWKGKEPERKWCFPSPFPLFLYIF